MDLWESRVLNQGITSPRLISYPWAVQLEGDGELQTRRLHGLHTVGMVLLDSPDCAPIGPSLTVPPCTQEWGRKQKLEGEGKAQSS